MISWKNRFFVKLAIDLGSYQTRVWINGRGIVLSQPTCLAIDQHKTVLAVGNDAVEMEERASGVQVIWPVREGVVANGDAVLALLKVWLKPYWRSLLLTQPTVLVSVPVGSTHSNRFLIRKLLLSLGANEVITVAQSLAAAIGTGVPIADASGSYFMHLGAGTVETGVVSLGSIREWRQFALAGDYLMSQIHLQLESAVGILASKELLYAISRNIFTFDQQQQRKTSIVGKDVVSGQPVEKEVSSDLFSFIAQSLLTQYEELFTQVLESSPAALLSDLLDKGLLLSGGMAQINGLDRALSQKLKVPVAVVEDAELATIRGMEQLLVNLSEVRQSLGYHLEVSETAK